MNDIQGTILNVQGRTVSGNKTIYDVSFSDGTTYSTFDGTLAGKAQALMNQPVTARVKHEKKGQYDNYYFEDVAPAGQLPALALPVAPGTSIPGGTPVTVPAPSIPMAPPSSGGRGGGMSDEDKRRIAFMSAASTAATLVGNVLAGAGPEAFAQGDDGEPSEAETLFRRVAMDVFTQAFAQGAQASAAPAAVAPPAPVTAEAVAAGVNAEQPGAVAVGAGAPQGLPSW